MFEETLYELPNYARSYLRTYTHTQTRASGATAYAGSHGRSLFSIFCSAVFMHFSMLAARINVYARTHTQERTRCVVVQNINKKFTKLTEDINAFYKITDMVICLLCNHANVRSISRNLYESMSTRSSSNVCVPDCARLSRVGSCMTRISIADMCATM